MHAQQVAYLSRRWRKRSWSTASCTAPETSIASTLNQVHGIAGSVMSICTGGTWVNCGGELRAARYQRCNGVSTIGRWSVGLTCSVSVGLHQWWLEHTAACGPVLRRRERIGHPDQLPSRAKEASLMCAIHRVTSAHAEPLRCLCLFIAP